MILVGIVQSSNLYGLIRQCAPTVIIGSSVMVALRVVTQQPTDMDFDTGIRPNETYDTGRASASIDTGRLDLRTHLVYLPGKHGQDLDLSLAYNGQSWNAAANLESRITEQNWTSIYIGRGPAQSLLSLEPLGLHLSVPMLDRTGVATLPKINSSPPTNGISFHATSS
jgi:hypothetical protein